MRLVTWLVVLLLPAIAYADAMNDSAAKPSLKMLLFIIGCVTSVLFLKGRQSPEHHTGAIPIIQSIIILVCFTWSHYILLAVDEQSLWEFYSNFIFNINKAFVGLLCVLFLDIGFVAVIYRTVRLLVVRIKRK